MTSVDSFASAVVILDTPSSSLDERLNALRFIQSFVESGQEIHNFTDKVKTNQIVLDNVMLILHREDLIPDLRKRQLVRAECFLMLARVLQSKTLFGGTTVEQGERSERLDISTREKKKRDEADAILNSTVHDASKDLYHSVANKKNPLKFGGKYDIFKVKSESRVSSQDDASYDGADGKNYLDEDSESMGSLRSSSSAGSMTSLKHDSLLSAPMAKSPNRYNLRKNVGQSKTLPRQSVISGAKLEQEPVRFQGVNPYDQITTDERIGYQKSRLWVPFAGTDINHHMIPKPRPRGYRELQAERITQDFLKMRALLSYVGDTVLPFDFRGDKAIGSYSIRKAPMMANPQSYEKAVKEAVQLWTPLFGATIPQWADNRREKVLQHSRETRELRNQIANAAASITPPPAPKQKPVKISKKLESKVKAIKNVVRNDRIREQQKRMAIEGAESILITKGSLRRLLRNELILNEKSKSVYRKSLDLISQSGSNGIDSDIVEKVQKEIYVNLEQEKLALSASRDALSSILSDTVKVQYASLPSRYLLVADRGQAASRAAFEKAMICFGNRRRLNYLALAMGIWKICLITEESIRKRPQYAKNAALILLGDWATNRKVRKIKQWFARWKTCISKSIFLERYRAALPIQCLYRVWRDIRKFKNMHLAGPYNGPLSDIYLAPSRGKGVKFRIPRMIRASRRMYWQAAILIQTHYRRFILRKEYYIKLRKVLLVQSIMRMFPKYIYYRRLKAATIKAQAYGRRTVRRNWYKRLKYCTIIAQKYIRRFLGLLLKFRLQEVYWSGLEEPMAPIILLQCRWRIFRAKKKCAAVKYRNERLTWAALALQRCWYRKQNAFHTFMLMCAYREYDRQEAEFERHCESMGRYYCARVIQKYYREHYYIRIIQSAIKIQCWYRGRKGNESVAKMRRVVWASRKLHHWAKARMKFRHRCSSKIAFTWFRACPGRYRMHMHFRIRSMDIAADNHRRADHAHAAAKIQALHFARKAKHYVKLVRAARTIQKPAKFFVARLMWKKQIYEKQHGWVLRIIDKIFGPATRNATRYICSFQNFMSRRIQKNVRGYICRRYLADARKNAKDMAVAVIRLQRFWRKSESFMKAVQEVMALRRLENNPYRDCETLHDVMCCLREDTKKYYHFNDPRVGAMTTRFLQRAGLPELLPIFAKDEKYKYASSLRSLTVDQMVSVSEKWLKKEDKNFKVKNVKPPKFPLQLFEALSAFLRAPLQPTHPDDIASLKGIQCIQEVMNRDEFVEKFEEGFIKRFGNSFAARAQNLSKSYGDEFWEKFNNYKTIGYVLTESITAKAFKMCKTPAEVRPAISKLAYPKRPEVGMSGKVHTQVKIEMKWDLERLKLCADCCQSACERALVILPDGPIREILSEVGITATAYKRRFSRQMVSMKKKEAEEKLKQLQRKEIDKAASAAKAKAKAKAKAIAIKRKKSAMLQMKQSGKKNPFASFTDLDDSIDVEDDNEGKEVEEISDGVTVCPISESVDKKFYGNIEDAELELHINVCKLYMDALEKVFIATKGVNSVKNHWHNSALRRSVREERCKNFLAKVKEEYISSRQDNHVLRVWERLRKLEDIKWREEAIVRSVLEHTEWINSHLDYLVRFGWAAYLDDSGYTYYYNEDCPDDATYEMPKYTLREWRLVTKIQWSAARFLERVRERRRLKDIEKAVAIANHERLVAAMLAKSKQAVTASIDVVSNAIRRICSYKSRNYAQVDHSPEIFLPFKYKFQDDRLFHPQEWVLMRFDEDPPRYVNGLVLKFSKTKLTYNIRLVSGKIVKNVNPNRVYKINYDKGSLVEARYRGGTVFYRGKITNVRKTADKTDTVYTILYDDGEVEDKVPVNLIRPSPGGIAAFLKERNRLLHFFKKREQRTTFYAGIRAKRLDRTASIARECESEFLNAWKDAHGRTLERLYKPGYNILRMIRSARTLKRFVVGTRVRVFYTKACLRFEWFEVKTGMKDEKGIDIVTYKNYVTEETSDNPPMYTSAEHFNVLKIHSAWSVYKARKNFKKLLLQESLLSIATKAIRQYQKHAFIGYKYEGVTVIQYMRRAGHVDAANAMAEYFSSRPVQFSTITLESFLATAKDKLKNFGLTKHADVQAFMRFREFWKKTNPAVRDSQLSFINSYEGMNDMRSMRKCIQDGDYLIRPKVARAYKNSVSRVKNIMDGIMKSKTPITKMQLDSFLEEFAGKAGLAQERVGMLVDQPVIHTYIEEAEALTVLTETTRRILYMLKNMKINSLRKQFESALKRVTALMDKTNEKYKGKERPLVSDAEARAALTLRIEVIDTVLRAEDAVALLQRRIRGITKRLWYLKRLNTRETAAIKLQAFFRSHAAQLLAGDLRAQKASNWEQLWDDNRRCIYFFNKFTNTSTYDDPLVPCRPLVRDFRSSALIQAWPDLEGNAKGYDISEANIVVIKSDERKKEESMQSISSLCSLCKEKQTKRICQDCNNRKGAAYCFACFSAVHSNDPKRVNHFFKDLPQKAVDVLLCCECEEPATRKCMGVLDEKEIDALCGRLQRAKASTWMEVLTEANVGGERKLAMMMDKFSAGAQADTATLTSVQLQQVRTMLERTRAECDECYCDSCYTQVHSGGKRALHRWVGFNSYASVCKVCTRAPAEVDCQECDGGIFCKSCFKVFHNKGRKKKHIWKKVTEELAIGQDFCSICDRRAATTSCPDCAILTCNSCLECGHQKKCPVVLARATADDLDVGRCVSCQEEADQICVQCGDLYCSRTWMGNPGCFLNYHNKGNRVNHVLEPLEKPEESPRADEDKKKKSKKSSKDKKSMRNKKDTKFTLPGIKS